MRTGSDQDNGYASIQRPVPYQPRMPRLNRAKLFAPYDALKPFESTVHAKDAVYTRRIELSEYAQECLDQKLRHIGRGDQVNVMWFQQSSTSDCDLGSYVNLSGTITRIDPVFRILYLGKTAIAIKDILDLRGEDIDAECEEGTSLSDLF